MDPEELNTWLDIATKVVGLFVVFIGGLWAYTKFVIERALLPPTEFTIDCNVVGNQAGKRLVEILLHLKNLGSSTLVATDIVTRLLYLNSDDQVDVFADVEKPTFARTRFLHSLSKDISTCGDGPSMIKIVPYDTFIRPGVEQVYTLVTAMPASSTYVVVKAQFKYARRPSFLQRAVIKFSRLLGLTRFNLNHATKPHIVERVFRLIPRN